MKRENHHSTNDAWLSKLIACLAAESDADLWDEYGEAAALVRQLAEIQWKIKVQRNMPGDAERLYRKRDGLIQRIHGEYPDMAEKLGLPSPQRPGNRRRKSERCDPEIAKRNALVRSNSYASAEEMCQIFDRQSVPLPAKWSEAGYTTWSQAYKDSNYRSRIHTLVSKAKNNN